MRLSPEKARELEGRAFLWLDALNECLWVLLLSIRALKYSGPAILTKGESEAADYKAYRQGQPDFQDDEPYNEDQWHRYLMAVPGNFILSRESTWLRILLPMLAVVRFDTIFAPAKPHRGQVGANASPHVDEFRERVLKTAFPEDADRRRFDAFLLLIRSGRNDLIAHTHGTAADRKQIHPGLESTRTAMSVTMDMDLHQWLDDVKALRAALLVELSRRPTYDRGAAGKIAPPSDV